MIQQARRWRPQRQPLLIVAGGCAAVSLPLACVKQHVTTRSRGRRDVALYHPPSPHRAASMAPTRCRGPRRLQAWAERAETPRETVAGTRLDRPAQNPVGLFSHSRVVHLAVAPRRHPRRASGNSSEQTAHRGVLLY